MISFVTLLLLITFVSCISVVVTTVDIVWASAETACDTYKCDEPEAKDVQLNIELFYEGKSKNISGSVSPVSSMTFLGNQILLLDKNDGTVNRIVNGIQLDDPLLDVNVANKRERGLLGIATSSGARSAQSVFLYYTESRNSDGTDVCPSSIYCDRGLHPLGNRLYKYELNGSKLINPKLLLDLPATPGPAHNGGVIEVGPDDNIYVVIGDDYWSSTLAQNDKNGTLPDGRAGILRITQDGKVVGSGILGDTYPLSLYYAYGIRNSFGLDFDPLTGNLWDTENGPSYGDEINLVKPGFNSGWKMIQGIWRPIGNPEGGDSIAGSKLLSTDNLLVNFEGKGHYAPPEFIWKNVVIPTAIKFLDSDELGKKYENDLFVGSAGLMFHFDLNKDRTKLNLSGKLQDKIADNNEELESAIFAQGLGRITDIEVGPDGYLYVLSSYHSKATIFRISPVKA